MSKPILIGAVRGLASEGERVTSIITEYKPDIIGFSLSKENIEAIDASKAIETSNRPNNPEERAYIRGLATFGEVIKPPPCFSMALSQARTNNIQIRALDMDDEHYTAAFCKFVNTMDMIRQGRRDKEFARHVFRAKTSQEFVVEWDRMVNRLEGYRALENAREKWFAKGIARLVENNERPLIIIELERLGGVQKYLKVLGTEFETH